MEILSKKFLVYWERLTELLLWAVMITPLIITLNSAIFPFIFPKVMYAELIIGLAAVAFLTLVCLDGRYRRVNKSILVVLGIYAVVLAISSLQGVDVSRSLWSNYERMTGAVFIWFVMALAFLLGQFYKVNTEKLPRFLNYSLVVAVVVCFTGLIQKIDSSFLVSTGVRVAGVFGNPIYLGGYAAIFVLLAIYLWQTTRDIWWRGWYSFTILILLAAGYYSGTRSAFLGLLAAGGLWFLWFLYGYWRTGKKRQAAGILALVIILFGGVLWYVRTTPSLQNTNAYRLTSIFSGAALTTVNTRYIAWQAAIAGWQERPVFGWGPENFYYVFNKNFQGRSLLYGIYETWFDHAHNTLFDILVTQGAVGLLAYLAQYAVLWYWCWRRRADKLIPFLGLILVVHFVHNIFVFDHPGSYVLFYTIVGLIMARAAPAPTTAPATPAKYPASLIATQVILLVALLYVIIPFWRQNYLDAKAQMIARQDLPQAMSYFKEAIALGGPHQVDVLQDVGRVTQQLLQLSVETLNNTPTFMPFALQCMDQALQLQPANALGFILRGQMLSAMVEAGGKSFYADANKSFSQAAALSPERQQIYYSWARLALAAGDRDRGIELLQKAVAIEPQVGESHWYLAAAYSEFDAAKSLVELRTALDLHYTLPDPQGLYLAARINEDNGLVNAAADFYHQLLQSKKATFDPALLKKIEEIFKKANRAEWQTELRATYPAVFQK